jgi:hypothetical protein
MLRDKDRTITKVWVVTIIVRRYDDLDNGERYFKIGIPEKFEVVVYEKYFK